MKGLDLFWENFKKFVEINLCAVRFGKTFDDYHQKTYLIGYDLQFDLCVSYTSEGKNKWKTRVELYGSRSKKQIERCVYFESQLVNMRKALPEYEVDFRIISKDADGASWKLYVGTNDLVHRQCEDVEIYKYYVKALNRMAEAWKPFFEPYKK
jgi:hypothetical protein